MARNLQKRIDKRTHVLWLSLLASTSEHGPMPIEKFMHTLTHGAISTGFELGVRVAIESQWAANVYAEHFDATLPDSARRERDDEVTRWVRAVAGPDRER